MSSRHAGRFVVTSSDFGIFQASLKVDGEFSARPSASTVLARPRVCPSGAVSSGRPIPSSRRVSDPTTARRAAKWSRDQTTAVTPSNTPPTTVYYVIMIRTGRVTVSFRLWSCRRRAPTARDVFAPRLNRRGDRESSLVLPKRRVRRRR